MMRAILLIGYILAGFHAPETRPATGIVDAILTEIARQHAWRPSDEKVLVDNRNLGSYHSSNNRIVLGDMGKVIAEFRKLERRKDYLLELQYTNVNKVEQRVLSLTVRLGGTQFETLNNLKTTQHPNIS